MTDSLDYSIFEEASPHIKTDYAEIICGEITVEEHNKLLIKVVKELLDKIRELEGNQDPVTKPSMHA
ncbi:MAG: hypothetical protein D9C04_03065 [Nitrosopumilus sp. B06]|nr:MAG: hypothetical protein EB828_00725 [Nitrosopumilus sp. D6]RNJ79993.1 MAG: hypothetical protein D9C04_03065 [Nitrosopumilus sp. B06]